MVAASAQCLPSSTGDEAAAGEQSDGVLEVSGAMDGVDSGTRQNAAGAQELAATAQALASEADSLQRLVRFFRVAA